MGSVARRLTRQDVVDLLTTNGADVETAEHIVVALERAGLDPPRMRSWLAHPQRGYSVHPEPVDIAGEEFWPGQVPVHAIEEGHAASVVRAAERFAAADARERQIASAFLCTIDEVRRLTHSDPIRIQQVAAVAELLLKRLGKDIIVNEVLQTRLLPRWNPDNSPNAVATRLVDCLADHRLPLVLDDLREGRLDPIALDREHDLDFYGW